MINPYIIAKAIEWMHKFAILRISKFQYVVGLDDLRTISKIGKSTFYKINSAVTALFTIWIKKSYSRSFINHSILVESIWHFAYIAGFMNIFDIQLPFNTKVSRSIIMLILTFFLG